MGKEWYKIYYEKVETIESNIRNLDKIGDKDESQEKNVLHGLCSIYFFNDLDHLNDYTSNGHYECDRDKFLKYWNNILETVQELTEKERKDVIGEHLNKNSHIFGVYEYGDDGDRFGYQTIGSEPPYTR